MKKIFSLVVALLTLVSCSEDFLNLTPQYYPNDATFFKTQEQFTQAVNGAYSALRGVSARQGYLMGEMRSDNTHYTRYKADRGLHILYRENIADFVVDDQNQWTNEMYYACYTGISRANTILNRIEYVIDLDAKYSEASFLCFWRKFNTLYNLLQRSEGWVAGLRLWLLTGTDGQSSTSARACATIALPA